MDDPMFWPFVRLRETIRSILDAGLVPNALELRKAFGFRYGFRPSAAKALLDAYCVLNGIVFDPYADVGRLLGTLLSKQNLKYVGITSSNITYTGLSRFYSWLQLYVPGLENRVSLLRPDDALPESVNTVFTELPCIDDPPINQWTSLLVPDGSVLLGLRVSDFQKIQQYLIFCTCILAYAKGSYETGPDKILYWQNSGILAEKM
jgi:hypothetical protein